MASIRPGRDLNSAVADPGSEERGAPGVLGACPKMFLVNFSQFRGLCAPAEHPPPLDTPLLSRPTSEFRATNAPNEPFSIKK